MHDSVKVSAVVFGIQGENDDIDGLGEDSEEHGANMGQRCRRKG